VATADDRATFDKARAAWDQSAALRRDQGKILVEQLEENLEVVSAELTGALVRGPRPSVHRRQLGRVREYRSYWSRQRAAVRALVQTEVSLASLGAESVRIAEETVAEVRKEYEAITGELNAAIDALRSWSPGDRDPLPHASSRLSSADERTRLWTSGMDRKVRRLLQDQIESVEPRRPLPGLRKPWRQIGPGRIFGEAVQTASATAREGFGTVETAHRSLIREIDRSREVVAYSLQAGRGDADRGEQLAVEGVTNALSLLTHSLGSARDPEPHLETHLVEATSAAFYQFLVAFERGRFSLTSYLAREGAGRAARTALDVAGEQLQSSGPGALEGLQRGFRWCLVQIGWAAPSDASLIPVETWSYFGGEKVSESLKELPLIYERLFRPEPVEDRRFLIGRDEEMTALEEACGFWKEGRFASVILEGERGSGKTSILNCAAIGPFAAENAVRTAVRERLLTAADVHAFLAGVLGVEPGDLRSDLGKQRRVIIIEEAERTFLRMVGGLEAIRELLSLIADTSRTNLWLLGMTREGYRFLDRALGLAGHFSHRLHASAVARSELQDAILQRHNLSGLRLEFTEPQSRGRIQDWLGRQTARVESPEDAFFRGLHELSGGVFRSAFSTWRRHIERVDGGVLRMRRLDVPDHSRLARALSREDLYSLQMILQHGSLTPAEHARMFDCPPSESQARMAHLAGRGILEPEPSVPGFRIQPEAVILVRGALNGRNLV
jgi:hypothetical protein